MGEAGKYMTITSGMWAGLTYTRHDGPEQTLDIGGGVLVNIKPGDYTRYNGHQTLEGCKKQGWEYRLWD